MAKRKKMPASSRSKRRTRKPSRTYASSKNPAKRTYSRAKKNPIIIYRPSKRKNPASGSEVMHFAIAGTSIGLVQPMVAQFAGKFGIPGQWITPLSTAGTGIALSYAFNFFRITKRLSQPAFILGIATGIVSAVAPWIRRLLMPTPSAQAQSNGVSGIGIWNGQPSMRVVGNPAAQKQMPAAKQGGVSGIGVWSKPAGRFRRA